MITYQDFVEYAKQSTLPDAVYWAIQQWQSDALYKTAIVADLYERQKNKTISDFMHKFYSANGMVNADTISANNKIASNIFHRLNTQRCAYSLGNGVTFAKESVKDKFGYNFDNVLYNAGYNSLIHGVNFLYVSDDVYKFDVTEFAPLWDEETGALVAGVRFWQLDAQKPLFAILYEEDGYTKYRKDSNGINELVSKTGYIQHVQTSEADGAEVIGEENYSELPIVPLWGSKIKQSTLVGMRAAIDAMDIIRSGFANDLQDCAQVYWIVENYGGMNEESLAQFRDQLKLLHIANINSTGGGKVAPYTQEPPYVARKAFLDDIKASIYEDFGALDVHTIAAGATNDHIDAAYQPMDEQADDFEMQIITAVQRIGAIKGIPKEDCVPLFKRNRISNQREQVDMIVQEAEWLDEQTILEKLPNITVDEVKEILKRKDAEDRDRMTRNPFFNQQNDKLEENEDEVNNG